MDYLGAATRGAMQGFGFMHGLRQDREAEERRKRQEARQERQLGMQERRLGLLESREERAIDRQELEDRRKQLTLGAKKLFAMTFNPDGSRKKATDWTQADADMLPGILNQYEIGTEWAKRGAQGGALDEDNPYERFVIVPGQEGAEPRVLIGLKTAKGDSVPMTWARTSEKDDPVMALNISDFITALSVEADPTEPMNYWKGLRTARAEAEESRLEHARDVELEEIKAGGKSSTRESKRLKDGRTELRKLFGESVELGLGERADDTALGMPLLERLMRDYPDVPPGTIAAAVYRGVQDTKPDYEEEGEEGEVAMATFDPSRRTIAGQSMGAEEIARRLVSQYSRSRPAGMTEETGERPVAERTQPGASGQPQAPEGRSQEEINQILKEANDAISRGAPPEQVQAELKKMGIETAFQPR